MKKDEESGFILMIVVLLTIAALVIGFAVYRIVTANPMSNPSAERRTGQQIIDYEPADL